jgi:hypothetical protein
MDTRHNKSVSTPPNAKEISFLHQLATNVGDKQYLWHLKLIVSKIEHQNSKIKTSISSTTEQQTTVINVKPFLCHKRLNNELVENDLTPILTYVT